MKNINKLALQNVFIHSSYYIHYLSLNSIHIHSTTKFKHKSFYPENVNVSIRTKSHEMEKKINKNKTKEKPFWISTLLTINTIENRMMANEIFNTRKAIKLWNTLPKKAKNNSNNNKKNQTFHFQWGTNIPTSR